MRKFCEDFSAWSILEPRNRGGLLNHRERGTGFGEEAPPFPFALTRLESLAKKCAHRLDRCRPRMLKLRPQLIEHAQALLAPDVDREALLSGLEQAVMASKDFSEANPPRRRDLRVSPKFQYLDSVRA